MKEGFKMKKILAVIAASLMVVSFASCGQAKKTSSSGTTSKSSKPSSSYSGVTGGYTDAESTKITDEIKALVEKATKGLDGAQYTPVAYISSQVVAGTNHLILCKITPVTPDAVSKYALVTIYEDLDGNAEITEISETDTEAPSEQSEEFVGGYTEPETPEVTKEAANALKKASETLAGATHEAKALLGTQVVSGTNYMLLCKTTPSVPNGEPYYTIVTVYEDLKGNCEITDTSEFRTTEE